MTDFEQYQLNTENTRAENQAEGFSNIDPRRILDLINSFVVSPNVLHTDKSIIVGSGNNTVTLDPNKGLISGDITIITRRGHDPDDAGIVDGRLNIMDQLWVVGYPGSSVTERVVSWAPGSGANYDFTSHRFDMTGGQSSTAITLARKSNSPVIRFPNFESPPSTCAVGEITVASGKLYICTATDTWTVVGTQT